MTGSNADLQKEQSNCYSHLAMERGLQGARYTAWVHACMDKAGTQRHACSRHRKSHKSTHVIVESIQEKLTCRHGKGQGKKVMDN
jgi:hypothetical protein